MAKGDIETVHMDGEWHNRIEGEEGTLGPHPTKAEAVAAGRLVAQQRKVEHIIKDMTGAISERHSHGHDPRDVPG
jgi:Uncharacterized protein conserved in bacteria (DUF2188)